jgi:Zn-dependent peptidase ImmA (M78 family)/DNA-binding XRE family transcriptional regulator
MEVTKQATGASRFVPTRLQIARQARRLRQSELAVQIDKSPATISKWESVDYDHAPDEADIVRLSSSLAVAPSWFYLPFVDTQNASFFRSLRSELTQARDRVEARLFFLESIYDSLGSLVEFPAVDFPTVETGHDFKSIRREDIERFAIELREFWGIDDDPIDDLTLLIENAGVAVGEDVFESSKLDGVSKWTSSGYPIMLLAQDKNVAVRRRFDAAHELGHVYMHRHVKRGDVVENMRLIESQAMDFAGALLLPAGPFIDDADELSLDRLADIKPKWKVSIGAMIKRLGALEVISPEYERTLWKHYSYRGWRGFEPYDDSLEIERPVNIKAAIELIAEDGPSVIRDFQLGAGLRGQEIAELTGAPVTLFEVSRHSRRKLPVRSITQDGSNVIAFPGTRKEVAEQ